MVRDEVRRARAEAERERFGGAPSIDADRFPLLAARASGCPDTELLNTHGIRSRTTLLRRLRTEYENWRRACS